MFSSKNTIESETKSTGSDTTLRILEQTDSSREGVMKPLTLMKIVGSDVLDLQRFVGSLDKVMLRRLIGLLVNNGII